MPASKVIRVDVHAVIPTNGGTALFLGDAHKSFLIFIDNAMGSAIAMHIGKVIPPRPQTHDLVTGLMQAIGASLDRIVINHVEQDTYFARMIVSVANEVLDKKLIELDARPSDAIALAVRMEAPIFVSRSVWDTVEDRSDLLREMQAEQQKQAEDSDD